MEATHLPPNRQIKCDLCNVWCSGVVSFQSHVEGRQHYVALQKKNGVEFGGPCEGSPPAKKKKSSTEELENVHCNICDLDLPRNAYESHINGVRHAKRIKETAVSTEVSSVPHIVESANVYRCKVCDVEMNGKVAAHSHIKGTKHNRKLAMLQLVNQEKTLIECGLCGIYVTSIVNLRQHELSARHQHKAQVAAKKEDLTACLV